MTDQPSREGERPTLGELANIARAGNIAGIDPEWLASTLQAAEAERDELQAWTYQCVPGEWWRIEESRAEAAEAQRDALLKGIEAICARWACLAHSARPCDELPGYPEELWCVVCLLRSLLSTQEPTR